MSIRRAMNMFISKAAVEEKTSFSLIYFDKEQLNDEQSAEDMNVKDRRGEYIFTNIKRYKFMVKENGEDISKEKDIFQERHLTVGDVSHGGVTLHHVPMNFFSIRRHCNFMYTLNNGFKIQWTDGYTNNYVHGDAAGVEECEVELMQGENQYEKPQGDDVGSSIMNVVNSFLTPPLPTCVRFRFVGVDGNAHPLPPSARHTFIVIPYVKKIYVQKRIKRLRSGKVKVQYGTTYSRCTYGIRRLVNGTFGAPITISQSLLRRMDPFYRYCGDKRRHVDYGMDRIPCTDDYEISLCTEDGERLISVSRLCDASQSTCLEEWLKRLFTHVEFGGYVSSHKDVPV